MTAAVTVGSIALSSRASRALRRSRRGRKLNEAIARWTDEFRQSTRILIYRR